MSPFCASARRWNQLRCLGLLGCLAFVVHGLSAQVDLVRAGQPAATIVIPAQPSPAVRLAAEELVYHVAKASGLKLAVVSESAAPRAGSRIYLGDTEAARAAGIQAAKLPAETFIWRTAANEPVVFIAGRDDDGDPLDRDTSAGTLFGVYEWLERELGVRWVWPGELGTFVPKSSTIVAHPANEKISPRFFQRHLRSGLTFEGDHPALGFTAAAAQDYAKEQTLFLRRGRMGRSEHMSYGHAFTNWWEKYGQTHPEWFQLVKGKRGPAKPGARYSMCVSNPGLHRAIVAEWKAKGAGNFINVVENDILGLCECENCRAWDGPPPADVMKFYSPSSKVYGSQFVSDRYARFAATVQKLAAEVNPKVVAISYVYFNYFQAPTSGLKLSPAVLLGYCPSSGWYPRADDEHAWYKKQWQGWRDSGARLFVRENYFLDGYDMPYIFAHQFADDFQHQVKNGLVATDFDSLTGHWATQGPNLYLLVRLHTRPDAKPDDLLAEYYSAFGPAAAAVKAYFDYWERYTMDNRPLLAAAFEDRVASRWRTWAKVAHKVYPPDCFAPAEKLLARAAADAGTDREAAARVKFLRDGLTHAQLCARTAGLLTLADTQSTPERGAKVLEELLRFRRAHEREWLDNLNHNAWVEDLSWKLSAETKQGPELYP
jgi:hypothetical protein